MPDAVVLVVGPLAWAQPFHSNAACLRVHNRGESAGHGRKPAVFRVLFFNPAAVRGFPIAFLGFHDCPFLVYSLFGFGLLSLSTTRPDNGRASSTILKPLPVFVNEPGADPRPWRIFLAVLLCEVAD